MIVPQEIYHPLYEDKEKFIILITGGRGSGKSFNASTFIERLTFEMTPAEKIVHQILYTRYTMVSAGMSIIPEMMEKIDLDGTTKYFRFSSVRLNRLRNKLLANYLKSGGNELATVRISAFCVAMLSNNSFICKYSIFFRKYELSAAVL